MLDSLASVQDKFISNNSDKQDKKTLIATGNNMMISSDSLFDNGTVVTAPTTPFENDPSPSEFFIPNNVDNITGHQETNTNLPSESQKEKDDDDDDSDEFITPTDEEGENTLPDFSEEKVASNETPKKEENDAYLQRTMTENEIYCIQTAINSRYINLDDILDKIRYNIKHGVYYSATSAQEPSEVNKEKMSVDNPAQSSSQPFAQEDVNQTSVTRPIEKPLPDQPHSDKTFPSANRSQTLPTSDNTSQKMPSSANTSQFYSTPSTPKAARSTKRKSILSINMKKKNCIIL